jgi:hypothetical protein
MATDTAPIDTENTLKKSSPRSPFPRLALIKVLALAKQIYELGEGDPVPRLVVFDRLGKSPDSGPSRMLVSTSNAYGLTTGGYQAERLGITDRGRAIVQSDDVAVSTAYAVKALLDNELFAQFYEKYQNKSIPQEAIAVDYLKQFGNLPEADAKVAYDVFLTNLNDYGFIKEMSGRATIISQSMMELVATDDTTAAPASTKAVSESHDNVRAEETTTPTVQPIVPQFNFNIQVQLPENATPETYDSIFKSMAEHLLKTTSK